MSSRKILIVGNSGVGKTCILCRYKNKCFIEDGHSPTINVVFTQCEVDDSNGNTIELQVWDTAGQEVYRSITSTYYREAQIALVCFDFLDEKSKEDIDFWESAIKEQEKECILYLVATKCDTYGDISQKVKEFVESKIGDKFTEGFVTSAKDNIQIDELFQAMANQKIKSEIEQKKLQESEKKDGCCH